MCVAEIHTDYIHDIYIQTHVAILTGTRFKKFAKFLNSPTHAFSLISAMPTHRTSDGAAVNPDIGIPLMHPRSQSSRSSSSCPVGPLEMTELDGRRLSCESIPVEKACFICLDGSETEDDLLVSCCTRCFAMCHGRCWTEWRTSQGNHARRVRLAGNRVSADPFLCSICKTGSARVCGERVTVRWLESFANFARSTTSHQVRFASGLFSALSGARDEGRTRGSPVAPADEENTEEDDFFDFMDSEIDRGNSALFCGNSKKFFLINLVMIVTGIATCMTLSELGLCGGETIFMAAWIAFYAYMVVVVGYVVWRFQQILTDRHLRGGA